MPIYEYECTQCGRREEILQKYSDIPLTVCKYCSGKVHKLISQTAFHLKGGGWYVTDYGSKSSKPADTSEKKAESSAEKSDTPKASDKASE